MRKPSNNPITLPFGATTDPYTPASPHLGTDFSWTPDDTIYAPFAGKVTQVPNNGNDGNGSYMTESNGRFHGMLHASKYLVANGSQVQEGQPIAVMGDTGYAFGVHLHYAVKENNKFIDPMSLVEEEPMFNEGDRVNVNNSLFGSDKGFWKNYVDQKTYKDALENILGSNEYLNESRLNSGDVVNINNALGQKVASEGKLWKDAVYNQILNNLPNGDNPTPLKPGVYEVK